MQKLLTLTIVHQGTEVLLGMKKRGFGVGRFNGFGGKVHPNESIIAGASRELFEESGIHASDLTKLGIVDFTFVGNEDVLQVHIFKCTKYTGEVGESEEMSPKWFSIDTVPFDQMWKDDIFWFEHFLQNRKFKGRFHFDAKHSILESELSEVEVLV